MQLEECRLDIEVTDDGLAMNEGDIDLPGDQCWNLALLCLPLCGAGQFWMTQLWQWTCLIKAGRPAVSAVGATIFDDLYQAQRWKSGALPFYRGLMYQDAVAIYSKQTNMQAGS